MCSIYIKHVRKGGGRRWIIPFLLTPPPLFTAPFMLIRVISSIRGEDSTGRKKLCRSEQRQSALCSVITSYWAIIGVIKIVGIQKAHSHPANNPSCITQNENFIEKNNLAYSGQSVRREIGINQGGQEANGSLSLYSKQRGAPGSQQEGSSQSKL